MPWKTINKDITLESYIHTNDKRRNNPPAGLVSNQTDKLIGKSEYAHDPHIDPQLSWTGKVEGALLRTGIAFCLI